MVYGDDDREEIDRKCDGCMRITNCGYDGRLDAMWGTPVCRTFRWPSERWKNGEKCRFYDDGHRPEIPNDL